MPREFLASFAVDIDEGGEQFLHGAEYRLRRPAENGLRRGERGWRGSRRRVRLPGPAVRQHPAAVARQGGHQYGSGSVYHMKCKKPAPKSRKEGRTGTP